jgi:hypothetical protein
MFGRKRVAAVDPLAHVDPVAVSPRYAARVADAVASRRRWQELVATMRPGPLRDRLDGLGAQVDDGVLAVWSTVQRLMEIERVVATVDLDRVTAELKRVRRDPTSDPAMVQALSDRFVSVQRMLNVVDDADDKLRLLDARLGAAVARAAEVVFVAGVDEPTVGDELGDVVTELESLRTALETLS